MEKCEKLVYSEEIRDINHIRERIVAIVASVTPEMLASTWEELDYHLDVCRATNGAHRRVLQT